MKIIPQFIHRHIAHRPNLIKIINNIGWMLFDKVIRMGVGLLVGVWIARYLGPEQFGLISFSLAIVSIFAVLASLGLQGVVVTDITRDSNCAKLTLGTAAMMQLVSGLMSYLLLLITVQYTQPNESLTQTVTVILGAVILFKFSDVVLYWFESQVQMKHAIWIQNIIFLVFSGIKILLIIQKSTILDIVWAMVAESVMTSCALIYMFKLRIYDLGQLKVSLKKVFSLLKSGWPLILSGLTIMIYMRIDQIMLGKMIGDQAVGIFSAAARISEVWYFIPTAITASVFPALIAGKKNSEKEFYVRLQKLFDLMAVVSILVALPISLFATNIIGLLFGGSYGESGIVLAIHIWTGLFVFFGVASNSWYLAENRQFLGLQRTALGAVVNIILNLILIPRHGAVGAAIATVISQAAAAWLFDLMHAETRRMFYMKIYAINPFRLFNYAH
jgi:PST family polysaccharide transporter